MQINTTSSGGTADSSTWPAACYGLTTKTNKRIQLPGTREYALACDADLPAGMGNITDTQAHSISDCIKLCETITSCTAASFYSNSSANDTTNCRLRSIVIGRAVNPLSSNGTAFAYVTTSTRCEALLAQGRRVKLDGQRDYTLQCGADARSQADIKAVYTGSINECMTICDRHLGCNAVTYRQVSQKCTLKTVLRTSDIHSSSGTDLAYLTSLGIGPAIPPRDQTGVWGPTVEFPVIPVAAAVIPNSNKIFVWSADYQDDYTLTRFSPDDKRTYFATMDITTGEVSEQLVANTNHNMFCPGISFTSDGRLVVTGGSTDAAVSIYDPIQVAWNSAAPMNIGRGYQSSVMTTKGEIFVIGGSWSGDLGGKIGEVYDPITNAWTLLPGCPTKPMQTADRQGIYRSDNHAWLFGWQNRAIFQAGPSIAMNWFSAGGSGSYIAAGPRGDAKDSMCGNAVMYDVGQIVAIGGAPDYDNSTAHAISHTITLPTDSSAHVSVTRNRDMIYPRVQANSVALPNGEVLVVGGQAFSNLFTDYQAVYYPEMFSPITNSFRLLEAPAPVPRTYHSVATLLPDGRVFTGGGGLCGPDCQWNHMDANIFEPPYLFRGNEKATRPVIHSISPPSQSSNTTAISLVAGSRLTVTLAQPLTYSTSNTAAFALMRAGSVTHSTDTDQRRIPLVPLLHQVGSESYTLQLPNDYGIMPAGWNMLFAMDDGVPSVAEWVHVALDI